MLSGERASIRSSSPHVRTNAMGNFCVPVRKADSRSYSRGIVCMSDWPQTEVRSRSVPYYAFGGGGG